MLAVLPQHAKGLKQIWLIQVDQLASSSMSRSRLLWASELFAWHQHELENLYDGMDPSQT